MKADRRSVAILGAGIAGLSIACELSENGRVLTVVEKSPFVGGIARSVEKDGFIFDLGGHRIYSDKKWVIEKVKNILGGDLDLVSRKSRIRLGERFIDYPPKPLSVLSSFGLWEGTNILASYISSAVKTKVNAQKGDSFEQWVVSRFGTKMYEIFFKPYTEKVCGLPCSEISADWGVKRVGVESLLQAFRKALFQANGLSRTYAAQFYYPRKGIGTIAATMADKVNKGDNRILLGWEVKEVRWQQKAIESLLIANGDKQEELVADRFISTIPLTLLVSLMRPALPPDILEAALKLQYRALVCILLIVDKERITDDHWIYFPDKDIVFARAHEPRNWSEELVRDGRTSLCVEILCSKDDQTWLATDEIITEKVVADLSNLGILNSDEVMGSFVERIPYAYPLLKLGYQDHLAELMGCFSQIENLHLIGRTGTFKYWGMDDVIEEAVLAANKMLR
ncbi:MAG TPA: NAD(P)-binding protein [Dehalococcoidia bacterium]|nr:NAD(P)-binding protein [Dehalococcoidia bacterium]